MGWSWRVAPWLGNCGRAQRNGGGNGALILPAPQTITSESAQTVDGVRQSARSRGAGCMGRQVGAPITPEFHSWDFFFLDCFGFDPPKKTNKRKKGGQICTRLSQALPCAIWCSAGRIEGRAGVCRPLGHLTTVRRPWKTVDKEGLLKGWPAPLGGHCACLWAAIQEMRRDKRRRLRPGRAGRAPLRD